MGLKRLQVPLGFCTCVAQASSPWECLLQHTSSEYTAVTEANLEMDACVVPQRSGLEFTQTRAAVEEFVDMSFRLRVNPLHHCQCCLPNL